MTKTHLSLFAVLVIMAFALSSYISGPAHHAGYDCSGAETGNGNPTGCSTGGSCHGSSATSTINVTIQLDSVGGGPVTKYRPGTTYTVVLTGVNNSTYNEAKFGFQLAAITGSTPQATPTNAGTWQTTGLPLGVQYSAAQTGVYAANVMEHNTALSPVTGTGAAGTVYTESLTWTAPAAGTGTISFWATLNAVLGLFDVANGAIDHWNTASLVLEEDTSTVNTTAIHSINNDMHVNIYPNPTTDFVQVELDNATVGNYEVKTYDAEGRKVSVNTVTYTGGLVTTTINTSNLRSGIYLLQFTNGDQQKVVKLVKR